jgi:hypothetical protein
VSEFLQTHGSRKIAAPTKPITAVIVSNIANVLCAATENGGHLAQSKRFPGRQHTSRSIEDSAQQVLSIPAIISLFPAKKQAAPTARHCEQPVSAQPEQYCGAYSQENGSKSQDVIGSHQGSRFHDPDLMNNPAKTAKGNEMTSQASSSSLPIVQPSIQLMPQLSKEIKSAIRGPGVRE